MGACVPACVCLIFFKGREKLCLRHLISFEALKKVCGKSILISKMYNIKQK